MLPGNTTVDSDRGMRGGALDRPRERRTASRDSVHVLLIHQAFVGAGEAGGTRHYEFGNCLLEKGHSFSVVASPLNYLSGQAQSSAKDGHAGIAVLRASAHPGLHRSFTWRVVSFLSFMWSSFWMALKVRDVDLVMGTTPPIFQAFSACCVARLRRKPFLLEVRDLWPDFAIDLGILKNRFLIFVSRRLERSLYRAADCILVNSPAYLEHLRECGQPAEKLRLIPNGVSPAMFDPDSSGGAIRSELGLEGRFVVTYAGAMGPANDLETLIRAASMLSKEEPAIHFLLVGDGKDRRHLEELARTLDCRNVTFTGIVPKERMVDVLAASDLCVAILKDIASFKTTYPNKVFDYMAAGRPIVLAIDGVIREVVSQADCGVFVKPGDSADLAARIRLLFGAPAKCRELGRNGRRHVSEHFNRERQALEFAGVVERLAGGK